MYLCVRFEWSCICVLNVSVMYMCVRRERLCICVLDVTGHVFVCLAFISFLSSPLLFSVLSVMW